MTRAAVAEMQRRRRGRRRRLSLSSLRRKSKSGEGDAEVAEVVKEQGRRFRKYVYLVIQITPITVTPVAITIWIQCDTYGKFSLSKRCQCRQIFSGLFGKVPRRGDHCK